MVRTGGLDHTQTHQEVRQKLETHIGDAWLQERQTDQREVYQ